MQKRKEAYALYFFALGNCLLPYSKNEVSGLDAEAKFR